jgi:transposase
VQQFLPEEHIPVVTQPPYSPDLVPSEFFFFFWLFPILKMRLKGTHLATVEDVKSNATDGTLEDSKIIFPLFLSTLVGQTLRVEGVA